MSSKKIGCFGVLLALIVVWEVYTHFAFPSGHFFYRTTVVVETPEGLRTGTAVRKINFHTELQLLDAGGRYDHLARGQAVVVDMGKRGTLFALMCRWNGSPDYGSDIVLKSFPLKEKTKIGEKVILKPLDYPMLVKFRDMKDPKTVERVVPEGQPPDQEGIRIEDALGNGVSVKEISLEIVDEQPVTSGIVAQLPWLPYTSGHLSGRDVNGEALYEWLETNAFITGKVNN